MIGIYDFSYAPYALGDALTWTMNVNIGAVEAGCEVIDAYLMVDPARPSSRYQPFIDAYNYVGVLDELFPAFLCAPRLRSLKVIRCRSTFNAFVLREALRRRPMWPPFVSHLNRRLDFISHRRIDAHHAMHGGLPWLTAPRGYGAWADDFRRGQADGRFLVAVNIRQSALSRFPAYLHRDSPVEEWLAFIRKVGQLHPEVLFVVLGGHAEIDREFLRLSNSLEPRAMGYGLGHELALVHRADLFMGSSSGFAAMATFCNVPYVITNVQHLFARHAGVPVGARHYRFGDENSILSWERETRDALLAFFHEVYPRLRGKAAS